MAVTLTDHRTAPNEADAITNWVGSPTLFTTDPTPVEATGCIGYVVSTATVDAYATVAAQSLADGLVYVWAFPRGAMDTRVNGGIQIHLGDGTNRIGFHLGGSDVSPFRHDVGPVGWQCMVMDTTNIPAARTVRAGSLANLNYGSLTQIGAIFKTLAKSIGGAHNCFVDVIRVINASTLSANNGCVMTVAGGTSGDPGTFLNIATLDRSTGNLQGYGLLRELGAGLYGLQGPLRFGNATGTASSWFEETNVALAFEARGLATSRYRLFVADNGVGTTTVKFGEKAGTGTEASGANGVSITSPAGVGGEWDSATDTDVTDVFVYGSTFTGLTNGVKFRSPQEWAGNTFAGCGQIQPNGAYMVNCAVVGSTASSALLWNVNQDTQGRLDGTSFVSGGTGHAIELGSSVPSELTFSGLSFGGYGANGTTNAAVYNNSGKALTIYVSGATPTVRNGTGASTTFVANPVTLTLTGVRDGSEVRIYKAGTRADELYGIESKQTGVDPSFTYTSPEPVDIIVHSLGYQYWRLENYALGTTNASLPVSQIVDRNYRNPP
jgi:hypothetical protein